MERMLARPRPSRRLTPVLLIADLLAILVSATVALLGRNYLTVFEHTEDLAQNVLPIAIAFIALWLGMLALTGAYSTRRIGVGSGEFNAVLAGTLLTAGTLGVLFYLTAYELSRGFYLLLFGVGLPVLLAERILVRRVLHRMRVAGALTVPVLLVGPPRRVDELLIVLRRAAWLGYDVVGALSPASDEPVTPSGLPILGRPEDIGQALTETGARLVIFTEAALPTAGAFNQLARELEDGDAQLVVVPALTDVSAGRMNMRPVAGLPLVYIESPRATRALRWGKRVFDIIGSSLALVVTSPVMAGVALAIKIEDRGPVVFSQTRAGLKGKPFHCYKFRSMVVDAEARLSELTNDSDGLLFKVRSDPRVTKVGRFIRRFSLDELPQLLNVLKGEMSLVGPRPALPSEVARYTEHVHRRLDVRPGLTGLWQVSGRSDLSWEDTVRIDLYYVDNWSLLQDMAILGRTVGAVLTSRGAY